MFELIKSPWRPKIKKRPVGANIKPIQPDDLWGISDCE
jgi:hypothetical protein